MEADMSKAVFCAAVVVAIVIAGMLAANASGIFRPGLFTPINGDVTPEQIAACAPDALRLCPESVRSGDRNRIAQCMIHARRERRISEGCRGAFGK